MDVSSSSPSRFQFLHAETDTKVERILKLVKSVNSGNKEAKQRKRSEVIHLIKEFYKQYQSMCALYEDLREGVKKKCNNEEDNESTSSSYALSMESAAYFSPGSGSKTSQVTTITDGQSMKSENSCHYLEALSVESSYKEEEKGRTVEKLTKETDHLRDCLVEKENKFQNLENKSPSKMKSLEDRIIALKLEIEDLNCENSEREFKGRHDEFHKRLKENSGFQFQFAFKEKEGDVLKKLDECEKFFNGKIEESMDRIHNLETEVDCLRSLNKNVLHEKEQELESLRIQNQEFEINLTKKTKEASDSLEMVETLETEVDCLRSLNKNVLHELEQELESLRIQNQESKIKLDKKTKEASDSLEMVERLETEVDYLRSLNKNLLHEKEQELESLRIQNQEAEIKLDEMTKEASDSHEIVESLETEVDCLRSFNKNLLQEKEQELESLRIQNQESEIKLNKKTKEASESLEMVESLETEVDCLRSLNKKFLHEKEQELESLRIQNQESEIKLNKKTKEASDSLEMVESLTEILNQKTANEEGLVEERDVLKQQLNQKTVIEQGLIEERNMLKQQIKDLELKIEGISDEHSLLKYENENQSTTISQLQEKLQQKTSHISALESEIERVKRDLSNKMKSLEQKFESLEIDKMELERKNDILAAALEERDLQVNRLNDEASSSFRTTVKKMGEMVDEFRKKSEDSIRILSRRIRVAEQLHNETRDWYKKTREKNEQDRKDCELALHGIMTMMSKVSDTLSVSETFGLRFVEFCEAFTNRVSKVSCEINFVKDWMKRKNSALVQLKNEFDELVPQLDDKEKEILGSRQKVLKLESKLRDLEKTVKENDETMIVLKEEKREAIRQLCVWIDYHRGRSDFYEKSFSELVARCNRPS